jgi:hypothetical protein
LRYFRGCRHAPDFGIVNHGPETKVHGADEELPAVANERVGVQAGLGRSPCSLFLFPLSLGQLPVRLVSSTPTPKTMIATRGFPFRILAADVSSLSVADFLNKKD